MLILVFEYKPRLEEASGSIRTRRTSVRVAAARAEMCVQCVQADIVVLTWRSLTAALQAIGTLIPQLMAASICD